MSSLLYLGFSLVAFLISFGVSFMLIPMVLGTFFSVDLPDLTPEWQEKRDQIEDITQWLPSVAMMLGIFIVIIKVLMTASVRGRD